MDGNRGILDRVAFLVAANVSALVNNAIESSSLAVFDEHIRHVRAALDALISAEGVQRGRAKSLGRRISAVQESIEQTDREIDLLLARGERGLAAVRQSVLNMRSDSLARLEAQRSQCSGAGGEPGGGASESGRPDRGARVRAPATGGYPRAEAGRPVAPEGAATGRD